MCWIWTWGKSVDLMTTSRVSGRSQCWLWLLLLWFAPGIMIVIIVARSCNSRRHHSRKLLNMDLRQRRRSYDYKLSSWPLAVLIVIIIIVVGARNYDYNYNGAKLLLLSTSFLQFVDYGREANPSILWLQVVVLSSHSVDYDYYYCGSHQESWL